MDTDKMLRLAEKKRGFRANRRKRTVTVPLMMTFRLPGDWWIVRKLLAAKRGSKATVARDLMLRDTEE